MRHPSFEFHCIPVGIDNCYLLRGRTTILIDAGAPGHVKEFMRGMDRLGISLREIELILLTHGHADHIGCLHQIQTLSERRLPCIRRSVPGLKAVNRICRLASLYGGACWLAWGRFYTNPVCIPVRWIIPSPPPYPP
ncbi:MAG TPA: hypothetical protein DCY14_06035 [Anaerolineae bacterium]|nr:hypothetical protein [Anaerolineae bacterium]